MSSNRSFFPSYTCHSAIQCEIRSRYVHRRVTYLLLVGLVSVVLAMLVSAGSAQLANTKSQAKSTEVSGFLRDYTGLYPDRENGDLLLYVKEKGILKKYDKFIVDPVTVQLLPEAQGRNLDPDDLILLAYDCRQALVDELQRSGRYQIVSEPGPGVLHMRAALTDVEPTRSKANTAVQAGAAAASATVAPGAALVMPRLSVGRASIEVEMLDSQSGDAWLLL